VNLFIHKSQHPRKIYSVKNNLKIACKIGEITLFLFFGYVSCVTCMRPYWPTVNEKGKNIFLKFYKISVISKNSMSIFSKTKKLMCILGKYTGRYCQWGNIKRIYRRIKRGVTIAPNRHL